MKTGAYLIVISNKEHILPFERSLYKAINDEFCCDSLQVTAIYGEVDTPKQAFPKKAAMRSFYVYCATLNIYTTFMAENIHHAGNKALKLWGSGVEVVSAESNLKPPYNLVYQTKFTKILTAFKEKN